MEVITITNQKGGVGKTTTAHVMACGLTNRGYRVLAIDADPQSNFTFTAGIDPQEVQEDLYSVFKGVSSLQVIQPTKAGFDIIAGSLNLAGADMEFTQAGREYHIKEALEPVKEKYDFCIIDTPPTLGILTVNALTASNVVIVPMQADIYSLQGLSQLKGMIDNVRRYCNKSLKIEGLLINQYSPQAIIKRSMKEELERVAEQLQTKVFTTTIRKAVAVEEAHFLQQDILKEAPKANVTKDFERFIDEFMKGR